MKIQIPTAKAKAKAKQWNTSEIMWVHVKCCSIAGC